MVRIPRITVATLASAVRGIQATGSSEMEEAVFQATNGSPLLALAVAEAFPFTGCAHAGCLFPMAHEGDHEPQAVAS